MFAKAIFQHPDTINLLIQMVFFAHDFGLLPGSPKNLPGNMGFQIALALQGLIPINMPAQQFYSGSNNINIGLRFRLHDNNPDKP